MALQDEIRQAEGRLKEGFKASLEKYYQWERDSRDPYLDSICGGEDGYEEDEEEE